jgi:hypothetical protein
LRAYGIKTEHLQAIAVVLKSGAAERAGSANCDA